MTAVVVKMTATVATLHAKARQAIDRGLDSFHEAAEYLAQAKKAGATVRDSADAIGMSKSWVQGLLAWRDSGYLTERPFQRLVQHAGQAQLPPPSNPTAPKPAAGDARTGNDVDPAASAARLGQKHADADKPDAGDEPEPNADDTEPEAFEADDGEYTAAEIAAMFPNSKSALAEVEACLKDIRERLVPEMHHDDLDKAHDYITALREQIIKAEYAPPDERAAKREATKKANA